jgi:hypothetical protein
VEGTLRRYLLTRNSVMAALADRGGTATDLVFPGRSGRRLHRRDLHRRPARYAGAASVRNRCSPHILRHSFALSFIRTGGQPFQLQVLLGHSSLEMTRRYCNLASQDAFEQGRAFNTSLPPSFRRRHLLVSLLPDYAVCAMVGQWPLRTDRNPGPEAFARHELTVKRGAAL